MAKKFTPPDMSNVTPEYCADELGAAKEELAYQKKVEGFFKTALAARWPKKLEDDTVEAESVRGSKFEIVRITFPQDRINLDKVKQILTPEQLQACTETSEVVQFRKKGDGTELADMKIDM